MTQKTIKKKIILILLAVMGFMGIKAQTCSSPIGLTANTGFTPIDSTNLSLTYYKFVATNTEHGIKFWVKNGNGPFAKLQLKCYTNNCGSLPTSEIVSISTTNADTFYVDLPSVIIGKTYLVELRNFTANYLINRISISNNRRSSLTSNQLGCPSWSVGCVSTNSCDLVCNGSFECQVAATNSISGISDGYVYNWNSPTSGTADLFSTAFPFSTSVGAPCNPNGNMNPIAGGTSYAGIIWANKTDPNNPADLDGTEYIQTMLTNTLAAGMPYTCSMWIAKGDNNPYQIGISQLGIFLTQGPLSIGTTSMITNTPNAVETNTTWLNQTNGLWKKISLTFTATGGEDHLTIGRPAGSTTIAVSQFTSNNCGSYPSPNPYAYLFIDGVSLVPTLTISANANFPVTCSGAPVNLTATSSIAGTTFTWMPGNLIGSSINVTPNTTTTYTLLASGGCVITNTASTTVVVTVTPQVITTSPNTTICINTSATLTANASVSPASFTWMPGNLTGSSVVVTPTATTIYTVTGTAANGCSATKTVQVNVFTPPGSFTLNASASLLCINQGQSTSTLTATGSAGLNYTWTPGPLYGAAQTVTPSATTIYTTTALSSGCIVTKTIAVAVQSACCTSTIPALTTTSITGVTLTGPKVINFDLTIYGNNIPTVFQNGEFLIAPNVKITVLGTVGDFVLKGAHLYACSTTMWKGIDILNGSRLVSIKSPTTGNSTLIEDALTAVNLDNVATGSSNLPLEITNTIFNKNYVAINISNVTTNSMSILFSQNVITSRSLTFTPTSWPTTTTTGVGLRTAATNATLGLAVPYLLQSAAIANLKNPYPNQPSRIGIQLNNVGSTSGNNYYDVAIGTSTNTGGATDFNLFDAQMFCIDATNSNFSSINNVFQNTQSVLICTPRCRYEGGTAIRTNINSNLNARLNMTAAGTNSTSYSLGNRFWNCHRGVEATNLYRLDCNYATFRSTQTTTAATSASLERGAYGISNNTNRFEHNIRYNNFNNINNPLSMIVYAGTYTYGVSSYYGVLANNILIDYNYFGAQLTNTTTLVSEFLNTAINLQSATITGWNNIAGLGLRIANNQFNRAWRGTFIDAFAYPAQVTTNTVSLLDDATILGTQYGIRSGNTSGITIANNKLNALNTTNTLVTLIYLNSSPASAVTCNTLSASYQGFEFNSNSASSTWKGNDMSNHARGMVLSNNGIIGTQGGSGSPSDNKWNSGITNSTYLVSSSSASNSILYTKVGSPWQSATNSGTVSFTEWYSAPGNTVSATGTYVCGSVPPPTMMAQSSSSSGAPTMLIANATNASAEDVYMKDNTIYRYLDANPAEKNSNAAYVNFYNSKANTSYDKFKQVEAILYNGQIAQAQTLNNSVSIVNAVEGNYKNYYTLYVKYKNNNFTSADSSMLINIAKLCPGVDGAIVYQARALYNLIYKTVKVYKEDCYATYNSGSRFITNANGGNVNIKSAWSVDLFPNPTSSELNIVSKVESENLAVIVRDLTGKIVYSQNLLISNFISKLDLTLTNGIYLVTINNNSNESTTKKLVITK